MKSEFTVDVTAHVHDGLLAAFGDRLERFADLAVDMAYEGHISEGYALQLLDMPGDAFRDRMMARHGAYRHAERLDQGEAEAGPGRQGTGAEGRG